MNTKEKDSVLVSRYIAGDENSLSILVGRYQSKIFNLILSKTKKIEVAEDIFQEVFIKVIKTLKKGNYKEEGKFFSWVMRIANNLIIDHYRSKSNVRIFDPVNEQKDIFNIIKNTTPNIENKIIKDQIFNTLSILVEKLKPEQRDVIKMRFYKNMSFKEIAENTDVSINTALGRMRYAIINIRNLINKKKVILT